MSESSSLPVKSITLMYSSPEQDLCGVLVRSWCGEAWGDFGGEVLTVVVGVAGAGGCGWELQDMISSQLLVSDNGYDSSIDVC